MPYLPEEGLRPFTEEIGTRQGRGEALIIFSGSKHLYKLQKVGRISM